MIRVALKAARLGVRGSRGVASLAGRNSRNQNVCTFRARQRILMAAGAGKSAMRIVIKS